MSSVPLDWRVEVIRGSALVLKLMPQVRQLAHRTKQENEAADVVRILSSPEAAKKIPVLVLVRRSGQEGDEVIAAVLLFEYRTPLGRPSRVLSTNDPSGRHNLFALLEERSRVAAFVSQQLLLRGAHLTHIAFHLLRPDPLTENVVAKTFQDLNATEVLGKHRWSVIQEELPLYLPLLSTYDETLASLGRRARSNLLRTRRRVEREIGCEFIAAVKISLDEFLEFNRECMYARTDEVAVFRYKALGLVPTPFFSGIRDGNGRWLALAGGRRRDNEIEVDWQMNRNGLPQLSLSTVLRACLIEHEIGLGTTRLYFEGGTPHLFANYLVREAAAALTVYRRTFYAGVLRKFGIRLLPPMNFVRKALFRDDIDWHPC